MRVKVAVFLCVFLLFTGCKKSEPLDYALALRNKVLDSNGCSFRAVVTADYGEKVYKFSMDCTTDKEGNLTFLVKDPATIAGISGKISQKGGAVTFDDKVLAFQTIADGQVTPVTAPWLLIKTLRSGYIKGCTQEKSNFLISIDDSYAENDLRLNITVEEDLPTFGEIFWKGRRVMTVLIDNFVFL